MRKLLICTTILFFFFTGSAMAYSIRDDVTGGDCSLIGTWDDVTKTCTISADVNETLNIDSDAITVDGAGYAVTASDTCGIMLDGRTGVTVRDFRIEPAVQSVCLYDGGGNTVTGNIIDSPTNIGIAIIYSDNNIISENVLDGGGLQSYGIYFMSYAANFHGYNTVTWNTINNFKTGMFLDNTPENTFANNTIAGYGWSAVVLNFSGSYPGGINRFYNNNFLGTHPFYMTSSNGGTVFNLELPVGGNYWEANTGCADADLDGICDSSYSALQPAYGLTDYLPWTIQDGWLDEDNDGYNKAQDCNDADPSINITPDLSIPEIPYNGVDENCNGMDDDNDVDLDGYLFPADCNDNNASIYPGAAEIPYNGIDENCNGMDDDNDVDLDGYPIPADCNDNDASVYPGAAEVKHDGIDQDCNWYDLTIDIVTAEYKSQNDSLQVEATSALGAGANLQLNGFGPLTWSTSKQKWEIDVKSAGGNPGSVTVSGVEGIETAPVTEK